MSRGRPPTPTALKVLQGNPGHRPLDQAHEPAPEPAIPDCPSFLTAEAKREWWRLCEDLYKLGLLTNLDRSTLAAVCSAWGNFERAEKLIAKLERERARLERKRPKTDEEKADLKAALARNWGQLCVATGARKNALKEHKAFTAELGLSPAARTRIKVTDGQMDLFPGQGGGGENAFDRVGRLSQA